MSTVNFLAEWAIRSSVLIAAGALLLWALRVKHSAVRLAGWTAMLLSSLAIPALMTALPKAPMTVMWTEPNVIETPAPAVDAMPSVPTVPASEPFDWTRAAFAVYLAIALALLLRLPVGLAMSFRLLRRSRATEQNFEGLAIRESDDVAAPVTMGIVRPVIVLPGDWRKWDGAKLNAVLEHERSHIRRFDPAMQLLSAMHRAVLWHSPLSWFLHRRIVRTAEDASDDAAVAAMNDRAFYAEVLLDFMRRGVRRTSWMGVPMARYESADARIQRILDGATLPRGRTRWSVAAILALASPLAYLVATAHPSQAAPQVRVEPRTPAPVVPPPAPRSRRASDYLTGLGNAVATTVMVTSKVDGQLKSLDFEEGKPVQAGQLLASIDSRNTQEQLERALALQELAQDTLRLRRSAGQSGEVVVQLENATKADEQKIDELKAQVVYGQVKAPFAGIAGLRKVDPGNFVHSGDVLVVIAQLQPMAVVFTLPQDVLPQVLSRFRAGENPTVEAWNRDMTVKLATGRLTAVDNLIDESTGMIKLKAMFDNKDSALFPNQFVNVRLLMNAK